MPARATALIAVLALLFLVACGDNDDGGDTSGSAGSPASGAPTRDDNTPPNSQDLDPETGLPRTFPPEFPVYTNAEVFRASEHQDRFVVEWRTPDEIPTVAGFYEGALAEPPWEIVDSEETDGVTMINFTGDTDREYTGALAVALLAGETRIFLNLNFGE